MSQTNIDLEILITLIENRPILWDKTLENYKENNLRTAAWREVCIVLREDFKELEEKERQSYGKFLYLFRLSLYCFFLPRYSSHFRNKIICEKEQKRLALAEKKMVKEKEKKDQTKRKRPKKNVFVESDSEDDDIPKNVLAQKPTSLKDSLKVGCYVIVKYEGEYFPGQVKNIDGCNANVSTMVCEYFQMA